MFGCVRKPPLGGFFFIRHTVGAALAVAMLRVLHPPFANMAQRAGARPAPTIGSFGFCGMMRDNFIGSDND